MKQKFLLMLAFLPLAWASGQTAHRTGFDPARHGFKFSNTFKNALPLDIRTGGLCGGMVYSALDYYYRRIPIPTQDYRPAERTTLQSYIYNRQLNSLTPNLDKWAEVGTNPGGARDNEFFEWGLKAFGGGRIQELKEFIDKGRPVPLGLQGAGGQYDGGGHQVLAIGYDMGRYKGDLGNYKEDFKIFIYDPNNPGRIMTLVPDLNKKVYYLTTGRRREWRTYFVDKKYTMANPPRIPTRTYPKDGKIYELVLEFDTGDDDLRGNNDNVDVVINRFEGASQRVQNANLRANWMRNYDQSVSIPLSSPVTLDNLKSIDLITSFGGGIGGDNWDLKYFNVRALGGNVDRIIYSSAAKKGNFLNRFTGDRKSYTVVLNTAPPVVHDNKIRSLNLDFYTGSDDLRGGNDNLDITVVYGDGHRQLLRNVNNGIRWTNSSRHAVRINLDRAVTRSEIKQVILSTTFRGGIGGDNWNMNRVDVSGAEGTTNRTFYTRTGNPLFRFTGDRKTFTISL